MRISGRKGRRLKVTLYDGSFSLDLGIVWPGQQQAKATITLDPEAAYELAHRLDGLIPIIQARYADWAEEQAA